MTYFTFSSGSTCGFLCCFWTCYTVELFCYRFLIDCKTISDWLIIMMSLLMNIYNLAYNSAESQWLMPELIFAETSEAEIITLARENACLPKLWWTGLRRERLCRKQPIEVAITWRICILHIVGEYRFFSWKKNTDSSCGRRIPILGCCNSKLSCKTEFRTANRVVKWNSEQQIELWNGIQNSK